MSLRLAIWILFLTVLIVSLWVSIVNELEILTTIEGKVGIAERQYNVLFITYTSNLWVQVSERPVDSRETDNEV